MYSNFYLLLILIPLGKCQTTTEIGDAEQNTESFDQTLEAITNYDKTVSELVNEQTEAIKKIISAHQPAFEQPVLHSSAAETEAQQDDNFGTQLKEQHGEKETQKTKEEKENESIEELKRKCEYYFKLFSNKQNDKFGELGEELITPLPTVLPFGPPIRPQFLQQKVTQGGQYEKEKVDIPNNSYIFVPSQGNSEPLPFSLYAENHLISNIEGAGSEVTKVESQEQELKPHHESPDNQDQRLPQNPYTPQYLQANNFTLHNYGEAQLQNQHNQQSDLTSQKQQGIHKVNVQNSYGAQIQYGSQNQYGAQYPYVSYNKKGSHQDTNSNEHVNQQINQKVGKNPDTQAFQTSQQVDTYLQPNIGGVNLDHVNQIQNVHAGGIYKNQNQNTPPIKQGVKYVRIEPVVLQKTLLSDGKTLYYWFRRVPGYPNSIQIPNTLDSSYSTNNVNYDSAAQETSSNFNVNTAATKDQLSQNSLPSSLGVQTQFEAAQQTAHKVLTTPAPPSTTTVKLPSYDVQYSTTDGQKDAYQHQLKFIIPLMYPKPEVVNKYPWQFDPYAYYPTQLQPNFMNVPVPYAPTFHMIRAVSVPNKLGEISESKDSNTERVSIG